MTTLGILVAGGLYLLLYHLYGRRLERKLLRVDDGRPTPAQRFNDGMDFVPTRREVLFGHHFASIAGASPIVGPAIAMAWGWLPGLLWIWMGNVFLGAVHDYLSLMASVRNDGRSIQWLAGRLMSSRAGVFFQIFILFTVILILAAFASIIASLFTAHGEVATASILFILAAVITGWLLYRSPLGFLPATLAGLALTVGAMVAGFFFPIHLSEKAWLLLLGIYAVGASSLPVWTLLQPRDYLNAFLLWVGIVLGAVALLLLGGKFSWPAFTTWSAHVVAGHPSPFWPVVPLIIACGALSGFHALVASGTTSKQLAKESDALFVGFGGMLTEGFLSTVVVLALAAFGVEVLAGKPMTPSEIALNYAGWIEEMGGPVGMFARAYALAVERTLHLPAATVSILASLWVSAFALTTLDTTARVGRMVIRELLPFRVLDNPFWGALGVVLLGTWLAWGGGWRLIWPAFGGANQMLASIALMTAAIWVIRHYAPSPFYRFAVLTPAAFLWLTVSLALVWYAVSVLPDVFARSPGKGMLLYTIVGVEIFLNLLLLYHALPALTRSPAVEDTGGLS